MEVKVIFIITFPFICLSMLQSVTAMQIQKLPPVHEQGLPEMILSPPQMPRKLRFLVEKQTSINGGEHGHSTSNQEKNDASFAGEREQRMVMHGGKGTWLEGSDTSHLFTIDYSHVKRRRPIHNKSLPVAP